MHKLKEYFCRRIEKNMTMNNCLNSYCQTEYCWIEEDQLIIIGVKNKTEKKRMNYESDRKQNKRTLKK